VLFKYTIAKDIIFSGEGIICGVVNTGAAVVGVSYIVKPTKLTGDVTFPSEEYPFECLAIFELFLTPAPNIVV
jgi:hypothetical protein